jgi:hypothetical protein
MEIDPTLESDLQATMEQHRLTQTTDTFLDRDVALLRARVEHEAAKVRAHSAKDMKTSTGRLVWATWVLAGATVALVLSTVALIIVTANT